MMPPDGNGGPGADDADRIGRYRVIRKLGRGGMGEVFLAANELKRLVAIKMLPPRFAKDPMYIARLEREARALAALQHRNIAAILDFERTDDGRTFLVIDYIRGETLDERIRREGAIPVLEVARIGAQIAAGIECAHTAGVIHRDLKPSNIMIDEAGEIRVLDFGLAKFMPPPTEGTGPTLMDPQVSTEGQVLGTAGYMSPEQLRGRRPIRPSTDIFSLGCVLYECLTGRMAFEGETDQDRHAATIKSEPDWRKFPADTPSRLSQIVVRCLEKNPERRLDDIGLIQKELASIAEGGESPETGTSPFSPVQSRVPEPLTRMIGRDTNAAAVRGLVREHRLVTLTGPGGIGKSRLSLRVAAEIEPDFADGVHVIDFEGIKEGPEIATAIAAALSIKESSGRPIGHEVLSTLASKHTLLVLENCERVATPVGVFVRRVFMASAEVRVLATSRVPLHVMGEQRYPVGPLTVPDEHAAFEQIVNNEAVRLLIDRVQLRDPGFRLRQGDARAAAQICRLVDGHPLALELVAARVPGLGLESLSRRLLRILPALRNESLEAPQRQQSIAALTEWSYGLLTRPQQILLERLSIFGGGWTLDAAEHICRDEAKGGGIWSQNDTIEGEPIIELLSALTDHSLVMFDPAAERYTMLATIRDFTLPRFQQGGGAARIAQAHLRYYAEQVDEIERANLENTHRFRLYETEHGNIRAALEWAVSSPDGAEAGLRIVLGVHRFWYTRGYFTVARQAIQAVVEKARAAGLERNGDSVLFARVLTASGMFAWRLGKLATADREYAEALEIAQASGNKSVAAGIWSNRGMLHETDGRFQEGVECHRTALALYEEINDSLGSARVRLNLAALFSRYGKHEESLPLLNECLPVFEREKELERIAPSLRNHAECELRLNRVTTDTLDRICRSLRLRIELEDWHGSARTVPVTAAVLMKLGRPAEAAAFTGLADGLWSEPDIKPQGDEQSILKTAAGMARAALGDEAFEEAYAEGFRSVDRVKMLRLLSACDPSQPPEP